MDLMSGSVERVSSHESHQDEKTALPTDEKMATPAQESDNEATLEHGHMQELEVDMALVLKEEGEEDYEGDQSPYPEGALTLTHDCVKLTANKPFQFAPLFRTSTTKLYQSTRSACGFWASFSQYSALGSTNFSVFDILRSTLWPWLPNCWHTRSACFSQRLYLSTQSI